MWSTYLYEICVVIMIMVIVQIHANHKQSAISFENIALFFLFLFFKVCSQFLSSLVYPPPLWMNALRTARTAQLRVIGCSWDCESSADCWSLCMKWHTTSNILFREPMAALQTLWCQELVNYSNLPVAHRWRTSGPSPVCIAPGDLSLIWHPEQWGEQSEPISALHGRSLFRAASVCEMWRRV